MPLPAPGARKKPFFFVRAPRAGHIVKRAGNEGRVVSAFLETGFEEVPALFLGLEVFLNVPTAGFDFFGHDSILRFSPGDPGSFRAARKAEYHASKILAAIVALRREWRIISYGSSSPAMGVFSRRRAIGLARTAVRLEDRAVFQTPALPEEIRAW
ncbi:MAG: DUF2083 domain-containing protein [Candidatus Accumulibacter sp.]|nr:DUF2083 domain-containing protein [Accumulibacter sp.]